MHDNNNVQVDKIIYNHKCAILNNTIAGFLPCWEKVMWLNKTEKYVGREKINKLRVGIII